MAFYVFNPEIYLVLCKVYGYLVCKHRIEDFAFTYTKTTFTKIITTIPDGTRFLNVVKTTIGGVGNRRDTAQRELLGVGIPLPVSDLDDLLTPGHYYWASSSAAPTNAFVPVGSLLIVLKFNTQVFQIQIPNTATSTALVGIGIRKYWNGSWDTAWYKIATTTIA